MRTKQSFAEEVKHRQAEREHTLGLSSGQRYILREMRLLFGVTTDEEIKAQINVLEKAFRGRVTKALNKELNLLRRNGVTGGSLLTTLANLFHQQHGVLDDRQSSPSVIQFQRSFAAKRRAPLRKPRRISLRMHIDRLL